MGLAVYNSITLDIRFPPCCYKKLLSPPTVPSDQNTPVGICSVTIDDLCQIMPVSMLLTSCSHVVINASLYSLQCYSYFKIAFPFRPLFHLAFSPLPQHTHILTEIAIYFPMYLSSYRSDFQV